MIWQISSAVKVAGAPERGKSDSVSMTASSISLSSPLSPISSSFSQVSAQRLRQVRTVWELQPNSRPI